MPLYVEVSTDKGETWQETRVVHPGDPVVIVPHFTGSGQRQLYLYACTDDDSKVVLCQTPPGMAVDLVQLQFGVVTHEMLFKVISTLRPGESHTITIRPEKGGQKCLYRFIHR